MTQPGAFPVRRRIGTVLSALSGILFATEAAAQAVTFDLTEDPACASVPDPVELDFVDGQTIMDTIAVSTPSAGEDVEWTASFSTLSDPSLVECEVGGPTNLSCENGFAITLPGAIADSPSNGVSTVASSDGAVMLNANLTSLGTAQVIFEVELEDNAAVQCSRTVELDVVEPVVPFDLAFVLDKSGSMSTEDGSPTRWDALVTGMEGFLGSVETEALTAEGSRMGVTFFDSGVPPVAPPDMFLVPDEFDAVEDALELTPGGSTAMGLGLQDAVAKADETEHCRTAVLFTDGRQNVDPEVNIDGTTYNDGTEVNPGGFSDENGVRIVTIGIANPDGDYLMTLQELAAQNGGVSIFTDNGTDFQSDIGDDPIPDAISGAFTAAIQPALDCNSPQQIATRSGQFSVAGAAPVPVDLAPFEVNRKVEQVVLTFAFSRRLEREEMQRLARQISVEKDGADISSLFRPLIYGNSPSALTMVADFTRLQGGIDVDGVTSNQPPATPDGSYAVTLVPSAGQGAEFRMTAFAEDRRLTAEVSLSDRVIPVNGEVEVTVNLDWLGRPIEDASVVVRAFAPGEDMGIVLTEGEPIDPSAGDDAASAGVQKFDHLVANDPDFLERLALSPNAVEMTHQGDGRWTGTYDVPNTVGMIHFVYDVAAESAVTGPIQRTGYQSVYARFDEIDHEASILTSRYEDGGNLLLTYFPRRSGEIPIGPGQVDAIAFDGVDVVRARDLQDGSYEFVIPGDQSGQPVSVTFLGEPVYSGPADWDRGSVFERYLDWLRSVPLWLLIPLLVVLALILWVLLRRRYSTS